MTDKITINPYDKSKCIEIVETKYLNKIKEVFGYYVNILYDPYPKQMENAGGFIELRQQVFNTTTPRGVSVATVISGIPFYYLDTVLAKNPLNIIDVGCGDNLFSKIVPGVYGIDPRNIRSDEQIGFDEIYAAQHKHEFDCAFSIDALHFISIFYFRTQVELFANIIKPGGRGFISMNVARMMEHTPDSIRLKLFNTTTPSKKQVEDYIDSEIKKLSLNFLIVDNLISEVYDEYMDGNIRLVFEV